MGFQLTMNQRMRHSVKQMHRLTSCCIVIMDKPPLGVRLLFTESSGD